MKKIIIVGLKIIVLTLIGLNIFMGLLFVASSHIVPQKTYIALLSTMVVLVSVFLLLFFIGRNFNKSNE